jgi:hypothetical protein
MSKKTNYYQLKIHPNKSQIHLTKYKILLIKQKILRNKK